MNYVIVKGVKPYDGRYELDPDRDLTTREWGWIKRLAGYVPLTLNDEAMSDPELGCVFAAIAMCRAGRIDRQEVPAVYERLLDVSFEDAIVMEGGEGEAGGDAGPPEPSLNGNASTSGVSSTTDSETSDSPPSRTGTPASDTSPSAPPMSVT